MTDQEILDLIAEAQRASLSRLTEHYTPWLWRLVNQLHKRVPRRVDAGDLFQQAWLGLRAGVLGYRLERANHGNPKTYLRRRVLGAMLDWLRDGADWWTCRPSLGKIPPKCGSLDELPDGDGDNAPPADLRHPGVEDHSLLKLERQDFRDWLLRPLAKRDRILVLDYYVEQKPMKRIGEELGLAESTVSINHTRIVKQLRQRLESRQEALT